MSTNETTQNENMPSDMNEQTTTNEVANTSEQQNVEVSTNDFPKEIPVNPEAQKEQDETYQAIKNEVGKIGEDAASSDDFKNVRKNIVEAKEKILALFLISKSAKDELIDKLQEAYEVLSKRQDEIRSAQEKEFVENYENLKPKFDAVIAETSASNEFKKSRERLIELQTELKEIKIKRDQKEELYQQIQKVFSDINAKQDAERESFEMESSENYLNIKPKIDAAIEEAKSASSFKDARAKLIDLQNQLKDLKLKREKRDELYSLIREAFNDLNLRQDEQRKVFDSASESHYTELKTLVDETIEFVKTTEDFAEARQRMISVQNKIKDATLRKLQRDELFGAIREIFTEINSKQGESRAEYDTECNENFARLEVKVGEASANAHYSNDFRDIREGLIAVQDEVKIVKLKREQRNELFKRIRAAFEVFDAKRNEFTSKRVEEKKNRLNGVLTNLNSKYERLEESIKIDTDALASLKERLSSNPDDFNANENIKSLEQKIADKNSKLDEAKTRIDEVKKEIEEVK